jgi:essential nuclear protein 1
MACCPALFLKGFLFPLLESHSCTLTEASLLASVIRQVHIPSLHTATALMHLTEIPFFTLAINVLVLSLLEKRQTLPYRVVDSLVIRHFCQWQEEMVLPLIWYQSLLTFVNRQVDKSGI